MVVMRVLGLPTSLAPRARTSWSSRRRVTPCTRPTRWRVCPASGLWFAGVPPLTVIVRILPHRMRRINWRALAGLAGLGLARFLGGRLLLRRGGLLARRLRPAHFRGAAALRLQAAFQGVHDVDDLAGGRRFRHFEGLPLLLGPQQADHRFLIAIAEL